MIINNTPGFFEALTGYQEQSDSAKKNAIDRVASVDDIVERRRRARHDEARKGITDLQDDERFAQEKRLGDQRLAIGGRVEEEAERAKSSRAAESKWMSSFGSSDVVPRGMEHQWDALQSLLKDDSADPDAKRKALSDFRTEAQKAALGEDAAKLSKDVEQYLDIGAGTGGVKSSLAGTKKPGELSKAEQESQLRLQQLLDSLGGLKHAQDPGEAAAILGDARTQFRDLQRSDRERTVFLQGVSDAQARVEELRVTFARNPSKMTRLVQIGAELDHPSPDDPERLSKELNDMETGADEMRWGGGRHVSEMPVPVRQFFREQARESTRGEVIAYIKAWNTANPFQSMTADQQFAISDRFVGQRMNELHDDYGWDASVQHPGGEGDKGAEVGGQGTPPDAGGQGGPPPGRMVPTSHGGVMGVLADVGKMGFEEREASLREVQMQYVVPRKMEADAMPDGPEKKAILAEIEEIAKAVFVIKKVGARPAAPQSIQKPPTQPRGNSSLDWK